MCQRHCVMNYHFVLFPFRIRGFQLFNCVYVKELSYAANQTCEVRVERKMELLFDLERGYGG